MFSPLFLLEQSNILTSTNSSKLLSGNKCIDCFSPNDLFLAASGYLLMASIILICSWSDKQFTEREYSSKCRVRCLASFPITPRCHCAIISNPLPHRGSCDDHDFSITLHTSKIPSNDSASLKVNNGSICLADSSASRA